MVLLPILKLTAKRLSLIKVLIVVDLSISSRISRTSWLVVAYYLRLFCWWCLFFEKRRHVCNEMIRLRLFLVLLTTRFHTLYYFLRIFVCILLPYYVVFGRFHKVYWPHVLRIKHLTRNFSLFI